MAGYTHCQQLLYFDVERHIRRSFTTRDVATSTPVFHVTFHLSCKCRISNWVLHEDSSEQRHLKRFRGPMIKKLIRLNLKQFLSKKVARKIIGKKIKDWPMWSDGRRLLMDFALEKAWEEMESMPPSHNSIHLYLHVIPEHKHIFNEGNEIRSVTHQSMEEAIDGMVPVVKSSIDSLENTTLIEGGTCAICLEEFVNNCEGVSTPCSHIFHGECIKRWLSTSHDCPVCRFQMPTS